MRTFREFLFEAVGKGDQHLTFGSKLKHHTDIGTNMPDADFWIVRKGTADKVGTVTDEFSKEHIGVKVRNHNILPSYLRYALMYVHQQGYFKQRANGTLNLQNIKVKHVEDIPIQSSPYSKIFSR